VILAIAVDDALELANHEDAHPAAAPPGGP
jgi:hypothetical protein